MYAIDVENLAKSYGNIPALRGLSLQVNQGEVYGLLGPNGSGKSTFIYLLLGFLKPSKGHIRVLGSEKPEAVRSRVGYLPEQLRYHLRFTAREYLSYLGHFSDLRGATLRKRIEEGLSQVGLSDVANRKLATFSKGMLQRIGIAQALLVEPDLLLLDEPTSGLDPSFRYDVLDMLVKVRAHGHTILICTHHLDVIEHLCDRVGILAHGKLVSLIEVDQIRGIGASVNIQVNYLPPELKNHLTQLSSAVHCSDYVINLRPNSQILQNEVLRILIDANIAIVSLESLERPIEHLYLEAVRLASSGQTPQSLQPKQPDLSAQKTSETPSSAQTTSEMPSSQAPMPPQESSLTNEPNEASQSQIPPSIPSADDPLIKQLLQKSLSNDSHHSETQQSDTEGKE